MEITQGNWIARINNIGIDVVEEKTGFGIVDLGNEKKLEGEEYPIEEAKANAMLIAAAPDLLNAAIEMVNAGNEQDWEAAESLAIDKLHKAIEKARGHN